MRLPECSATSFAALANDGLEPGVRVFVDDDAEQTGTVCFAEAAAPFTRIRLDRTGTLLRIASWRLACVY